MHVEVRRALIAASVIASAVPAHAFDLFGLTSSRPAGFDFVPASAGVAFKQAAVEIGLSDMSLIGGACGEMSPDNYSCEFDLGGGVTLVAESPGADDYISALNVHAGKGQVSPTFATAIDVLLSMFDRDLSAREREATSKTMAEGAVLNRGDFRNGPGDPWWMSAVNVPDSGPQVMVVLDD